MPQQEIFFQKSLQSFKFLLANFDFVQKPLYDVPGLWKVIYFNATTAIEVIFEVRDQLIYVNIHHLINGEIAKPYAEKSKNSFYLDNLLKIRNTNLPPFSFGGGGRWLSTSEIEDTIEKSADALRTYAADILQGDFSILPEIQALIHKYSQ